jgi:hypothetical protein
VKVQIIHLDASDDQISAREKLAWVQASRTLLVWPKRGSVLASRLDLRLVARAAAHRGATLGLVTHDPTVRDHAADLGIPVFDSIDDLPEERWRVTRYAKPRRLARPERSPDLAELRRLVLAKARDGSDNSQLVRWIAFTLSIAAVLALLVFVVPSSDVVLTPKTQRQSLDLTLVLDPDAGATSSEGVLPARRVETTLSAELRTPTTGFALAPSGLARGTVVFTNLTGEEITIPAGTGVRAGDGDPSVRFETLEDITLEAEEGSQTSVEVEAVDPGPSGNLAPGAIDAVEGPIGLLVSATNPERTSGGRTGPQAGVSARDMQDLEQEVRTMLISQAERTLSDELRNDEVLAPASVAISQVIERDFDHEVGQPAESLKLNLRATVSGLGYSRSDMVEVAEESLDARLSPKTEAVPGSFGYEEATPTGGVGSNPTSIRLRVWREVFTPLDKALAKKLVRGQDPSAAVTLLARQFELGALPRIRLHPGWWPRMPLLDVRIAVFWPWGTRG